MDDKKTPAILIAAGAVAGLTFTYLARRTRARLRRPVTQAQTILVERERVHQLLESQEEFIQVLGSREYLDNIDRLEVRDAPDDRGTEMYLTMRGIGKYATKDILRRAKALLEAGEIPTAARHR